MFNQLLKWTAIVTLWKKFRRHILATALLLLALFVTSMVHADYLQYANAAQQRDIAGSFFIKWGLNLTYVLLYLAALVKLNRPKVKTALTNEKRQKNSVSSTTEVNDEGKDPFESIRKKKKLKSNADLTIEKAKSKRH